ncbi:MAG: glutamine-hydrolyzing GMP synthase [Lentisphaerae bacterium]|nr:glutamine-hydrolyzing GMP synthase [Lentisphaerota bacterium]MBT4818186.1 glutamine-hydrolyzing GMP synthase [Lentisphaerota bacterium]MBT5610363.1 glutamine-hydrolyzing GMP synthase [Lentisphaerota bacterium]MBT7056191.1 glutamine-hydrolyzing GMP synthase [Lentisphaerota bacterium]MBT7841887.1 glutamine-hydrolyzing GMP synthase [Lentisphaerota bacterium]
MAQTQEKILILDFGSQYTQLIARRVRECRVYSEIVDSAMSVADIRREAPSGLILSGGPASVHGDGAPGCDPGIFELGIPILGICYGLQWITDHFGGRVQPSGSREYGQAVLRLVDPENPLLARLPEESRVWMSHADEVVEAAPGFDVIASSDRVPFAGVCDPKRRIWGVQFHPEVVHTKYGKRVIRNFTRTICGCKGRWSARAYVEVATEEIRAQVGEGKVILGLSGGVDSTVAAVLIHRAIGEQLTSVFVDNGVLRHEEAKRLLEVFRKHLDLNVKFVDAGEELLDQLAGIEEPEKKRKVIGHQFVEVFRRAASEIADARFLAQGTTYPDVIESSGIGKHADNIKSHHNVGGLPAELGFEALVEPLKMLFKDEVRALGKELGLPDEIVWRQPFPGPGLAVRILGEVTPERVATLQQADRVVIQEMKASGWYRKVWQSFAVLLPVQTVGVMGDGRTYENAAVLRIVQSSDGMTADWVPLPHKLLGRIATRITNEVKGINRVVYDITSKPPSTIEWE